MKTRCGLKVNSHDGDCDVFLEPPCCKFSPNVERLPEPVCGNTSAWCRARRGRSGGHDNAAPRSPALGSVIEREPQVLCLEPTTSSHHSSAPSGLLQPVPRDSWASQACSLPPSKGLLWGTRWARTRRPGTVRAVLHLLCCRCEKAAALLHRAQTPLWPEDFPWYLHPLLFFCFFLPHVHHKNLSCASYHVLVSAYWRTWNSAIITSFKLVSVILLCYLWMTSVIPMWEHIFSP